MGEAGPASPAGSGHLGDPGAGAAGGGDLEPPLGGRPLDRLDCLSCHAAHPEGWPRQLRADLLRGQVATRDDLDAVTRLCLACHPLAGKFRGPGRSYVRHPVGVRPSARLAPPAGARFALPLADAAGTADPADDVVACTTCHLAHAGPHPFLLRWPAGEMPAACGSCHPGPAGPPGDVPPARGLR